MSVNTSIASEPVRLQKWLAEQGVASRRQAEQWIEAGRVTVNGKCAKLGDKVTPKMRIAVDKKLISAKVIEPELVLYHKPVGVECSANPSDNRPSIFDEVPPPKTGKWISVGRLDVNTSGLILMTNDGKLAEALMHPRGEIQRIYRARVHGRFNDNQIRSLASTKESKRFVRVKAMQQTGANGWYEVKLKQGHKHEVRQLFESIEGSVNRLIRIQYGPYQLPRGLKPGASQSVSALKCWQWLNESSTA